MGIGKALTEANVKEIRQYLHLNVKRGKSSEAESIKFSSLSNTKDENEPPPEGGEEEKNPEAEKPRRTRIEVRKEERTKVRGTFDS